ncbi:MAG TPA: hypothetical protein PLO62_12790, partial [Candidatus Hydrogenedentes bacterium]|nr:hypothetical protein [Candidatus Hydrogenedentota bacterium]
MIMASTVRREGVGLSWCTLVLWALFCVAVAPGVPAVADVYLSDGSLGDVNLTGWGQINFNTTTGDCSGYNPSSVWTSIATGVNDGGVMTWRFRNLTLPVGQNVYILGDKPGSITCSGDLVAPCYFPTWYSSGLCGGGAGGAGGMNGVAGTKGSGGTRGTYGSGAGGGGGGGNGCPTDCSAGNGSGGSNGYAGVSGGNGSTGGSNTDGATGSL